MDDDAEAVAAGVVDLNHGPGGIHIGGVAGNLDELLPIRGGGNLPAAMLDLAPDEAMVELAIALSLQDQDGGGGNNAGGNNAGAADANQLAQGFQQGLHQLGLAGILGAVAAAGNGNDSDGEEDVVEVDDDYEEEEEEEEEDEEDEDEAPQATDEAAQFSDTTASAPGSDDDDGSMVILKTC